MESTGISPKIQVSEILPMSLVPPNQFELSDCQEIVLNNTYIWDLPASPVAFGLLWRIGTFPFSSTKPLSVTNHMATQKKPPVPALHVALVHFQLYSTLWAVETRRSLSISSHWLWSLQTSGSIPCARKLRRDLRHRAQHLLLVANASL